MPFMNWTDDFSVGIAEIDSDHKKLVELLNDLYDAVDAGSGREVLSKTLEGLVLYVSYHFRHEEGLFLRAQYPVYEEHKKLHEMLTARVMTAYEKFHSGEDATLPRELLEFLKDWLYNHIMGADKNFGLYVNTNGIAL